MIDSPEPQRRAANVGRIASEAARARTAHQPGAAVMLMLYPSTNHDTPATVAECWRYITGDVVVRAVLECGREVRVAADRVMEAA